MSSLATNDDGDRHLDHVLEELHARSQGRHKIVFVSGNFNILHPGHLRLLNFAASCGDFLVVGVNSDENGNALLSAAYRLEGVRSVGIVNYAFVLDVAPAEFIRRFRPAVVVKGKEHEGRFNDEKSALDEYDGTLLFSSGEVRFSSLDLLQRELLESNLSAIQKPRDFAERHDFRMTELVEQVHRFAGLRVLVVGDIIVDDYMSCEPLGMSREDPTLVVAPIKKDRFVGGAGIVAAHASTLGAEVSFFTVTGDDEAREFALARLEQYGVRTCALVDTSRPTTLKQRIRADGKTLLRISYLRQHDIGQELADELDGAITAQLESSDLVVFSDFNYGCLPQGLVDRLVERCVSANVLSVADSQASSQLGNVSRFRHMALLTPTEHEARLAVGDQSSGLVVLAEKLRERADAQQLLITLGAEGMLIHARGEHVGYETDRLPAMNSAPKDASGAGDSLFICSALSLASGASIWRSAYLGAVAAALQVGRVGNLPLSRQELVRELLI